MRRDTEFLSTAFSTARWRLDACHVAKRCLHPRLVGFRRIFTSVSGRWVAADSIEQRQRPAVRGAAERSTTGSSGRGTS